MVITEGRIAVALSSQDDFPASSVKSLEKRFSNLREYIQKNYSNSIIQWRKPHKPMPMKGVTLACTPRVRSPGLGQCVCLLRALGDA